MRFSATTSERSATRAARFNRSTNFPGELTKGTGNYHTWLVIKATSEQGKTAFNEEINLIGPFN